MFEAYFIVWIVVLALSLSIYLLKDCKISLRSFGESFGYSMLSIIICMFLGVAGSMHDENTFKSRTWEPQYGDSYRVVVDSANSIEVIDYNGQVYYRFVVFNEKGLLEVINVPADNIEKVEISGVKPSFVPIKRYKCITPCKLTEWFGLFDVTIKEDGHVGKLVVSHDTCIRSLSYKLIEI